MRLGRCNRIGASELEKIAELVNENVSMKNGKEKGLRAFFEGILT